MAIIKEKQEIRMRDLDDYNEVLFICPVCKSKKKLKIPSSIIDQAKQLASVSISKGLICQHGFQAFIDKNFKVRGYQKVDFEFESQATNEQDEFMNQVNENDEDLFKNLKLEGNHLEYVPKKLIGNECNVQKRGNTPSTSIKREMTLEEIYEEFWEFIEDNNDEFVEFIIKYKRRNNQTI